MSCESDECLPEENLQLIGSVSSFFSGVGVAAIQLTGDLKVGDNILFKGSTTNYEQSVTSMQIKKVAVQEAKSGDDLGIKVLDKVRSGDKIYKRV
ncbi:translation elongation factor-like protein [Candidatus Woesearchaeota archaeon]|nr:translation elongation factor-like protein [Candidatus Woesearchaeota archaeon]